MPETIQDAWAWFGSQSWEIKAAIVLGLLGGIGKAYIVYKGLELVHGSHDRQVEPVSHPELAVHGKGRYPALGIVLFSCLLSRLRAPLARPSVSPYLSPLWGSCRPCGAS